MRFESLFVAALSAAGTASAAVAIGSFVSSCDAGSVRVDGRYITANCRNIVGQYVCSRLDLNRCVKNSYGTLASNPTQSGPGYTDANQCYGCTNDINASTGGFVVGRGGETLLRCQCNPGTGAARQNWPVAFFDLNTIVDNMNGNLECYGTKGTRC